MELIQPGHNLVNTEPLSEHEAKEIIRDVLIALEFCHRHGVVHRDLKVCRLCHCICLTRNCQQNYLAGGALQKEYKGQLSLQSIGLFTTCGCPSLTCRAVCRLLILLSACLHHYQCLVISPLYLPLCNIPLLLFIGLINSPTKCTPSEPTGYGMSLCAVQPANLLYSSTTGRTSLGDFGLAWMKGVSSRSVFPDMTNASIVGSPSFNAPELYLAQYLNTNGWSAENQEKVQEDFNISLDPATCSRSPALDIWSTGVVFLYLLFGKYVRRRQRSALPALSKDMYRAGPTLCLSMLIYGVQTYV